MVERCAWERNSRTKETNQSTQAERQRAGSPGAMLSGSPFNKLKLFQQVFHTLDILYLWIQLLCAAVFAEKTATQRGDQNSLCLQNGWTDTFLQVRLIGFHKEAAEHSGASAADPDINKEAKAKWR